MPRSQPPDTPNLKNGNPSTSIQCGVLFSHVILETSKTVQKLESTTHELTAESSLMESVITKPLLPTYLAKKPEKLAGEDLGSV